MLCQTGVPYFGSPGIKLLHGFKIGATDIKLEAFADGTTLFVKDKPFLRRMLKVTDKELKGRVFGLPVCSESSQM